MATATKRPSPTPPPPEPSPTDARRPGFLRAFEAVYRFLASLKLAVISLSAVSAVLAVGTYVESRYGTVAVQEWVYQSWWFAVLLAFLGTNILCAATIRYPWKRRQIGFLITHAGLLIVLAGSFWSSRHADEGQVALKEGDRTDQLVRPDHPVIRVREVDPHTRKPLQDYEYQMPFRPGALPWEPGRTELLTDDKAPFTLIVRDHLPASSPRYVHEQVPDGDPMIRVALLVRAPNQLRESNVLEGGTSGDDWLVANNRLARAVRSLGPAVFAFQYLDSDAKLETFLRPPAGVGKEEVVQIRYRDEQGKDRVEDWTIGGQRGKSHQLPDSDLTVTFEDTFELPPDPRMREMTGEDRVSLAQFKVREGEGPEVTHFGWAWLPMSPSVVPDSSRPEGAREELVHIDYYPPLPPGRMGMVEVAGMPDGRVFYRSINAKGLKGSGPIREGQVVPALGGGDMPMSVRLRVDDYLASGRERLTFRFLQLPVGELSNGIPAVRAELTVDGQTESVWLRRSAGFTPNFQFVGLPNGRAFEMAYDVDRKGLGFSIALDDFDVGLDPGTQEPSSYRSDIRLTDEAQGVEDRPVTISMNNTMTHRGWTFYQSNYIPLEDETGRKTGQFMSVFQVGHDPGRPLKYLGCLLVCLGAFVQFYMRAGVFTDGGKRERERAQARAKRRGEGEKETPPPAGAAPADPDVETL